ncbi:double zinc ribbon domain-containing protein [Natrinema longum]|uniref:double zinc ribbon domain-containing protein n=1 Tax=Natrinema longum TaxID=370324 RepID=UPI001CCAB9A5|nr:zinc ribbon domain-containing protein [Natrinema longum]MBZ6497172.1 zinc ribbon domain-containing protein [Natrinema longum]
MSRTFTQKLSAELDHNSEGTVHLYAEYDIHSDLRGLTLSFPDYLTPETTSGFSESQRHQCEWDGATENPWIRFRYDVDRTNAGGYEFVDTGGWALLKYPPINTSWRYSGKNVELQKEHDIRQEGVASSDGSIVYLGPHIQERFHAGGQTFRVAIPEHASLRPSLSDVRESLSYAAKNLDVDGKNDGVVVVVAPSNINWGWGGLQSGVNGFWAVDSSRVDHANNTWIHEYVHTRQEWTRDSSTQWLIEGTTNYYAALLTYLEGRIPFSAFHRYVTTDRHSSSVLVDPGQWTSSNAHYTKGRRVTAALDAKIRRETNGEKAFEDVFRKMNSVDGSLSHQKLKGLIRDVVGHSMDGWLSKYVKSSQTPDIPKDEDLFSGGTIPTPEPEPEPEDDKEDEEETGPDDEIDQCPVCGESVTSDQQFCDSCGTALFRQCPVCGRGVTDEPYCPECGTAIQEECEVCGARRHSSEEFCSSCGTRF